MYATFSVEREQGSISIIHPREFVRDTVSLCEPHLVVGVWRAPKQTDPRSPDKPKRSVNHLLFCQADNRLSIVDPSQSVREHCQLAMGETWTGRVISELDMIPLDIGFIGDSADTGYPDINSCDVYPVFARTDPEVKYNPGLLPKIIGAINRDLASNMYQQPTQY